MDEVVALCKRRGLIFPASEIYGGIANTYDYGHYGVLLKRNVKDAWWKAMIQERDDVVALDSAIIQHPRTWEASGHLAGFTDPLVDCRQVQAALPRRPPQEAAVASGRPETVKCPRVRRRPHRAARVQPDVQDDDRARWRTRARPSTCARRPRRASSSTSRRRSQYARKKPPFGIAQIGKSFRNEITPGNFIFRTLEFEQMEMEFFVPPDEAEQWYEYWCQERMNWYSSSASGASTCGCARTTPRSSRTTRAAPATSSTSTRSAGASSRASPTAATSTSASTRSSRGENLEYIDPQTGEGYLPHVSSREVALARLRVLVLQVLATELRVLRQVEVAAVGDALELAPTPRVAVLDVGRAARVVRELLGIVRAQAELVLGDAEPRRTSPGAPAPVLVPLLRLVGRDEALHLHLLELAGAEDEVPRRDLVAEGLADLRDAERRLLARESLQRRLEVQEDALRGLGAQEDRRALLLPPGPIVRLEHQVERARPRSGRRRRPGT